MRYLISTSIILLLTTSLFITPLFVHIVHAQANPLGSVGPEIAVPIAGTNVIAAQNYTGVVSVINYIDIDGPVAFNSVPIKNLNVPTVLRVDISANTSNENIVAYANSLNSVVDTEFPNGLKVIVLSVETNNLDWWYGTPGQPSDEASVRQGAREYAEKFILFAQTLRDDLPLAPAPPDLFNGIFNADPWMDEFTRSGTCPYVDYNVSDIFELTPTVGGGAYTWNNIHLYQQEKMCGKDVIHFEGWGINPNNPPPTVKQQVDWFQDTPLPPGIETATTLILPHCPPEYNASLDQTVNGFIDWWYYINGRVFTPDGLEIDPDTCSEVEQPDCYYDGNLTRPGGTCKYRVPYVHSSLSQYKPQCTLTPQGSLSRTSCGIPPTTTSLPNDPQEYMDVRLLVNYSQLQLGGLGPDHAAWNSIPLDNLARGYPYNALADKPLTIAEDTPKEAFRTWWRLLSLRQQIEAKAEFFQRFRLQDPPIFDSEFAYSQDGSTQTYTISQLEDALPDCLRIFPIPNRCGITTDSLTPEQTYYSLPEDTRAMYDAFLPFDFDNVRGYLALQYKDATDFLSGENRNRAGVLADNLPYIQALVDILSNKVGGVLTALSPQWLNTLRTNTLPATQEYDIEYEESGDIDLTPESQQSFTYMAGAARTNSKYGPDWASDLATACYNPEEKNPTLSSPLTYPQKLEAQNPYLPLPGSEYTDVLDQSVLVPTETSTYYGTPSSSGDSTTCTYETGDTCSYDPLSGTCPPLFITRMVDGIPGQRDPDLPVRSQVGRSIITFANPLMGTLSHLVSEPYLGIPDTSGAYNWATHMNLSLYHQMLTRDFTPQPQPFTEMFSEYSDQPMYAKQAQYQATKEDDSAVTLSAQAGGTGDQTGLVARKGGQLEIDLCELRNFWLRPDSLQVGEPEDCLKLDQYVSAPSQPYNLSTPGSTDSACQVKQFLFENSCPGGSCSSYVIDTALSTSCSGKVINPYFAITVALNENGGLTSIHNDGTNVKHFGCAPFDIGATRYGHDIPSKTSCFTNTIGNDCREGKTDLQTLQEYGYSAAYLPTLNNILRVLGACSADQVNQQQLCVSLWVSPSQAQSISNNLLPTLASQRSLWFRYYQGYLEAMATNNQCSLYQP